MKYILIILAAALLAGCSSIPARGATVPVSWQYPADELADVTRFVIAEKQPDGSFVDVASVASPALALNIPNVRVGRHTYVAYADFVPPTGATIRSVPSNEATGVVRPGAPTNLQLTIVQNPDGTLTMRAREWKTGAGRNARS